MCLFSGVGLDVVIQCVSLAAVGVNVWCRSHRVPTWLAFRHKNGSEF